jgi:hypothetical protein
VIGQGGAGVVMIGFDPAVSRRVALKVLHDSSGRRRDRLTAEARAMARVGHPNVVTLYELGDDAGQLFLVMELVEGTDVAGWLRERRRPWREIADVFVGAGRGLAAAHAVGVIHRDFKPGNVLLGPDGRPRVSDFGLAHTGDDGGTDGGTAAYMAPEQLEGAPADPQSDQFAFCASMWEALHGELPFAGTNAIAIATAARAGKRRPPARPEVPAAVNAVLARGLAPVAAGRFPALTELLATLERAIAPPRRTWLPWVAAGVVGAAVVTTAILVATRDRAPARPATAAATLADVRTAPTPGAALVALSRLPARELATVEARTLAARAAAGGPTRTIEIGAPITSLAFSADATRVLAGTAAGVTIIELDGPRITRTAAPPSAPVAIRLADDRAVRVLVSDGVVELPVDGSPARHVFRCPPPSATEAALPIRTSIGASRDLRHVACPTPAGSSIHDIATTPPVELMKVDGAVTFSPDGTRVAVHSLIDGLAIHTLAPPVEVAGHDLPAVAIVVDNGVVAAIAADRRITLWNPTTGDERVITTGLDLAQVVLTGGPDPRVTVTDPRGHVEVWNPDGTRVGGWDSGAAVTIHAPEARPDVLVSETATGLELRDLATNRLLALTAPHHGVAVSADGAAVAIADRSTLTLWFDLRPPRAFPIGEQPFGLIRITSDGTWLARRAPPGPGLVLTDLASGRDVIVPASDDATTLDVTAGAATVAFARADGRVMSWRRTAPAPPRELARTSEPIRSVVALDADHALVIGDDLRIRRAAGGTLTAPCGDRTLVRIVAPIAIVRAADQLAACDVRTGAVTALGASGKDAGVWLSRDAARALVIRDGAVAVVRIADGATEAFPPITDARLAALDATGERAVVLSAGAGVVVLDRGAAEPIVLDPGRGIARVELSPDGTRVAALRGPQVVTWDVARPDAPRVIGTHALQVTSELLIPDRPVVLTISAAWPGQVLDEWPDGPASPDDVAGWLRRVAPR